MVERDPITLAKEVASLDRLSGGRFELGIGAGWNREEMRDHGTDPRVRMAMMRERVLAMSEIWTQDEAEFHGEHVDFDPLWSWPKPVQQPHPPVLVGGDGPTVFDRVLELRRRVVAQHARPRDPAAAHRRAAPAAPRRPGREQIPVTYFGARARRRASRRAARAPASTGRCSASRPPPRTRRCRTSSASAGSRNGTADLTMAADWRRARAAAARVGHLATVTPDGRPHVVACCFALEGDRVWTAVDAKPKATPRLQRLANLRAHPRASLLVDHYEEDWTRLWWVRIDGPARIHDDGPERERPASPRWWRSTSSTPPRRRRAP